MGAQNFGRVKNYFFLENVRNSITHFTSVSFLDQLLAEKKPNLLYFKTQNIARVFESLKTFLKYVRLHHF